MECLIGLLNNTFIGTTLSGLVLAVVGLYLYRHQKEIDNEYSEARKIKDLASILFTNVIIAEKRYEAYVRLHDNNQSGLDKLYKILNDKTDNHFRKDLNNDFNTMTERVTASADDLIAKLKIKGGCDAEISAIIDRVPLFNFYLLGASVMHLSGPDDLVKLKSGFQEESSSIKNVLQSIINPKNSVIKQKSAQ